MYPETPRLVDPRGAAHRALASLMQGAGVVHAVSHAKHLQTLNPSARGAFISHAKRYWPGGSAVWTVPAGRRRTR